MNFDSIEGLNIEEILSEYENSIYGNVEEEQIATYHVCACKTDASRGIFLKGWPDTDGFCHEAVDSSGAFSNTSCSLKCSQRYGSGAHLWSATVHGDSWPNILGPDFARNYGWRCQYGTGNAYDCGASPPFSVCGNNGCKFGVCAMPGNWFYARDLCKFTGNCSANCGATNYENNLGGGYWVNPNYGFCATR